MTFKTIGRFLIGDASAIRDIAREKVALFAGAVLVLTAGIAREYDQTYFFSEPHKYFEPLFISVVSCFIVYLFVSPLNQAATATDSRWIEFGQFLALFWMTAPIAWLYAIPVERFLSPSDAARANIGLLCIVAGWRVILISRAISVLSKSSFARSLFSVLIPAAGLVFFASVGTSLSLIRLMGGMRYSPEESVIAAAAETGFGASIVVGLIAIVAMTIMKKSTEPVNPEEQIDGRFPLVALLIVLSFWIASAFYSQPKLRMSHEAQKLLRKDRKEFLAFLSRNSIREFSTSQRLPPDPYGYGAFHEIALVIESMDGTEAPWVREHYLKNLKTVLVEPSYEYINLTRITSVTQALERIPEGPNWASENLELLRPLIKYGWESSMNREQESKKLLSSLQGLGILDDDLIDKLAPPEREGVP